MLPHRLAPVGLLVLMLGLAAPAAAAAVATYDGTTYSVSGDDADDVIAVSCLSGSLSPASTPDAPCAEVTIVNASAGTGSDRIDLSAITGAAFPQVFRVVIFSQEDADGVDVLRGSQLNDVVAADDDDSFGSGGDQVFGEGGDDVILGGGEVDAGPGDDIVISDRLIVDAATGGAGEDRFVMRVMHDSTRIDGDTGYDTLDLDLAFLTGPSPSTTTFRAADFTLASPFDERTRPLTNVEHLDLQLPGADQTVDAADFPGDMDVHASGGNDTLIGTHQVDLLDGGSGDDIIRARDDRADVVRCGLGDDTAILDAVDQVSGCEHRHYLRNETSPISGTSTVAKPDKARFTFSSPTPRSTFQCRRDNGAWRACQSPWLVATKHLTVGRHKVWVRAVNLVGQVDLTPSVRAFRVTR